MRIVGVTGGIGSGKTTVCNIFSELGVPIYSADERAKWLMNSNEALKENIVQAFGAEAYVNGNLNRGFLAEQVFRSKEKLSVLNGLVHPAVAEDFESWVEENTGKPYVIKEAAILFESGADQWVDITVLVVAPEATRVKRVMERDQAEEAAVRERMANQWTQERKVKLADHVVNNDGYELLLPQILELHKKFSKQ